MSDTAANLVVEVSCPVCGSDRHQRLRPAVDRWMGVPGDFAYATCQDCGLDYLRLRPAQEAMALYYPADYIRRGSGPAALRRLFRRLDLAPRVALTRSQPGQRVLDVGCATGEYLVRMREAGWTVAGVEPTGWSADAAAARGLPVWRSTLADADLPCGAFDVATMWDVVEHLDEPAADLARVRSALRPGGRLLIATPVRDGWEARLYGERWPGWDAPRHLTVFTRRRLADLLRDAGFRVLGRHYIYESYLITAMAAGLVARERLPAPLADVVWGLLHARPLRLLMAPAFRAADHLLGGCWVTLVAEAVAPGGDESAPSDALAASRGDAFAPPLAEPPGDGT
ncbi:MAG: class I SAM-dependent methyltransferase [Anaerolineae bacterium]